MPETAHKQAMFAAGCFWGVEDIFKKVPGVVDTEVGYAGGITENPTYKEVCSDTTGHAEVVLLTYDFDQVSYEKLLEIFFENHNPTQLNRQGADVGTQYRSAIFTYDAEQREKAEAAKRRLDNSGAYDAPVVTQIQDAPQFWPAEDYHQDYFDKNPEAVCHI